MPAPTLRELERAFWRSIAGTPGAASPDPALAAVVGGTPGLRAEARIGVYARMYCSRLLDALREDFPRTAALLGDDRFATVGRGYLASHPSEHPSIRHVGCAFADHLAVQPMPAAPPFLADLARLEWARLEAFDAADARALTLDDLRALPAASWPELVLDPLPGFSLLLLGWPVHRIWSAEASAGGHLDRGRTVLRVWRQGVAVYHASVGPREEAALERLRAGEPYGGICEAFAELPPDEAAAEAGALLVAWVRDGLVVRRA